MAKPPVLTLEERSVSEIRPLRNKHNPKFPSLAKCLGYRLTHPTSEPNYFPTLNDTLDSTREYLEMIGQKTEKSISRYKRESRYRH